MAKQQKPAAPWESHTIVHAGSLEPVVPFDCNPGNDVDEGMLVYRGKLSADAAAKHQKELYGVACRAVPLSSVLTNETNRLANTKVRAPSKVKARKSVGFA